MKLPCNMIKDLLPLYVENMASEDSGALIEDHVRDCDACRAELQNLRRTSVLAAETDTAALKKLDRQIRRRRIHTAVLAILITASVLLSLFMYLYSPIYLSAEEAIQSIAEEGDIVVIEFSPEAMYYRMDETVDPDTGRKSATFIAAKRRWDILLEGFLRNRLENAGGNNGRQLRLAGNRDIWYASTASSEEDTLLWGNHNSGGRVSLPRLVMGYYFLLALLGGAVLLIPAMLLRGKTAGKVFGTGALLCFCFALSDLMATGGNWRIYDGYDVPILCVLILIQTVLLTASVVWGLRLRRTDRGE